MAFLSGRPTLRGLGRLASAALAAALVGTAAGPALADTAEPGASALLRSAEAAGAQAAPRAAGGQQPTGDAPRFALNGIDKSGMLFLHWPDGAGGFEPREEIVDFGFAKTGADVDNDRDGYSDGHFTWNLDGDLSFTYRTGFVQNETRTIGGGWNIYPKVLAPGDLGGAKEYDIMAVDTAGVMWTYLAYPNGDVTPRVRIGSGWDAYTHLSGKGDLTGDGRTDIVAKDAKGDLYLYKGTGDYKAPFEPRVKVGWGYNLYNALVSTGDVDGDGRNDLLAREAGGDLYLYRGTGNASDPFESRVKVGWGYDTYRVMF
ncbi:FG-GAP repeat domain-containing protein [Streptomyces sp. URMC 123]|uniref:FG-GAP repeat domain-containing protein n=1 Tax=Streptomyces sp. URMC 123 TaxID=3423403 RepID=UPI003F1BCDF0